MAHNCEKNGVPACDNEMDCPCDCNACNGAARRQLVAYVKSLTQNEAARLKPLFEQYVKGG